MRNYHIAVKVRHNGKHIEYKEKHNHMDDAFIFFRDWLNCEHKLTMSDISELDITETGESE